MQADRPGQIPCIDIAECKQKANQKQIDGSYHTIVWIEYMQYAEKKGSGIHKRSVWLFGRSTYCIRIPSDIFLIKYAREK